MSVLNFPSRASGVVAAMLQANTDPPPAMPGDWQWRTHARRGGVAVHLLAPVSADTSIIVFAQRPMDALDLVNPAAAAHKLQRLVTDMAAEAHRRLARIRGGV